MSNFSERIMGLSEEDLGLAAGIATEADETVEDLTESLEEAIRALRWCVKEMGNPSPDYHDARLHGYYVQEGITLGDEEQDQEP